MSKEIDWKALAAPFPESDIEFRIQSCGDKKGTIWAICLAYVTNRAIMDRLDKVVGPDKWWNEYKEGPDKGVLCGLTIRVQVESEVPLALKEGGCITKWDGAENTDIESVKGGLSNAMKRAAVQWGIGRYLYHLESGFATVTESGKLRGKTKDNKYFKWNPPALPKWALPGGSGKPGVESAPPPTEGEPMPPEPDHITLELCLGKIKDAKTMKHLQNIYNKYLDELTGEDKAEFIKAKDKKKVELTK